MKQLPGTVIHIIFDIYEKEGHQNNLSNSKELSKEGEQMPTTFKCWWMDIFFN